MLRRRIILDEIQKAPPSNTPELIALATNIANSLKTEKSELNQLYFEENPINKAYKHRFNNRYEVSVFNEGDVVLDKNYYRTTTDLDLHRGFSDLYQIAVMPMGDSAPFDLMPFVETKGSNDDAKFTSLLVIVHVLEKMGVKRVLVIVFSCGAINRLSADASEYVKKSARDTRYDRREIKRARVGGRNRRALKRTLSSQN